MPLRAALIMGTVGIMGIMGVVRRLLQITRRKSGALSSTALRRADPRFIPHSLITLSDPINPIALRFPQTGIPPLHQEFKAAS
jgi:hypothetical protein